jgi:hypothetical protein
MSGLKIEKENEQLENAKKTMIDEYREDIREYARYLAQNGYNNITTCAPWNEWSTDWKNCNVVRGWMLLFTFKRTPKRTKAEVWGFYSHTASDLIDNNEKIFEMDKKTMRKLYTFYF